MAAGVKKSSWVTPEGKPANGKEQLLFFSSCFQFPHWQNNRSHLRMEKYGPQNPRSSITKQGREVSLELRGSSFRTCRAVCWQNLGQVLTLRLTGAGLGRT